jgi:Glycosyl hydrolases family 16
VIEFEDTFDGGELDRRRWLPYYLPHWSSRDQAAARYALDGGRLVLRIDEDQEPWCPDLDAGVVVSSLQTGSFAGPLGSAVGQHRFHPAARVREEQEAVRLYTPRYARLELRARVCADERTMAAFWLIGYEDEPERSAEICVCEIFGSEVEPDRALVGMGVHPFGDPLITDDFEKVEVDVDVRELHTYAVDWRPGRVDFFVDGALHKVVRQAPDYPMQLMLGIYAFGPPVDADRYPKEFVVDHVRGYRLDPPA